MGKSPVLSVVFPVYGSFDINRAVISVKSALNQKEVNHEVIVSEQGELKRFPDIPGVKYVFHYHKPRKNLSDFNPGHVRNLAVAQARGEYLYTNDADIVFLDSSYLAKSLEAISKFPEEAFYRPFMRRLPLDEFNEFEKRITKKGIEETIASLDLSQDYLATVNGKKRKIRVFEKKSIYPKTFTAFEDDFQTYIGDESFQGREPMFWNENRHCGGNLIRMKHFKNLGGYSEEFVNWGCEDSDLQWKLNEIYDLGFFPESFEVLHLDHPKSYFSPEMWKRNEEISSRRVRQGVQKAIEIDRRNKLWEKK